MDLKKITGTALPHLVAVTLFIILSFAFFFPVLEGRILKANDSMVSTINTKEINDYRDEFGKEPLWTNSIFSGMPAYLISVRYPGNLIKYVDSALRIFKMPVSVLLISMAGFYFMLLMFGLSPWLSIAGSVAFGFSSFFFQILAAGHNTQAIAIAYMAPMIGGIIYAYRKDAIKGAIITGIMLTLEIIANHAQITYYAFICILIFIIIELIHSVREKTFGSFLKTSLILLIPIVLAIGVNFGNLYNINEYGKYSTRGKSDLVRDDKNISHGLDRDYIVAWSYGVGETMNLLIPNFKGGSSKPFDKDSETVKVLRQNNAGSAVNRIIKYWGTQPSTEGPHYMGALIIFLFILGIVVLKGREKWWLIIATIISIMLAWGKNFMPLTNLFIDFFPGYNKFRAVTMTLIIAQFSIPLLGFLALRDFYNGTISGKDMLKGLRIAGGVTAGILLLVLIFPGIAGSFLNSYEADFPEWLTTALISDRTSLLRADALRSLIFVVLGIAVLYSFISGKLKAEYSIALLAFLILIDLWGAGKRYLGSDRFERQSSIQKTFTPTTADGAILQDRSYHRVLNLAVSTFNDNTPTSYFHKSIGGYHGAKLERYQELIDTAILRELYIIENEFNKGPSSIEELLPVFERTSVLNMLNAKYLIYNTDAAPLVNNKARGNAWFVTDVLITDNANMELSSLSTLNIEKEAVVDVKFRDQLPGTSFGLDSSDMIKLVSYQPDKLEYRYTAEGERLAVFSEIYYPDGWYCYIDGKESSHFRTNYVLRGMILPAGSHDVKFEFKPSSYYTGNKISLVSSLLLILLTVGYLTFKAIRRNRS